MAHFKLYQTLCARCQCYLLDFCGYALKWYNTMLKIQFVKTQNVSASRESPGSLVGGSVPGP